MWSSIARAEYRRESQRVNYAEAVELDELYVVYDGNEHVNHEGENHDVQDLPAGGPVFPEIVEKGGFVLDKIDVVI